MHLQKHILEQRQLQQQKRQKQLEKPKKIQLRFHVITMLESWKNVNTVLEKEDVETNAANSNRIDLTEQLEKLKQLQNATIHMEFKPDASAPAFYNLFSVSSDKVRNEYFTMAVYNQCCLD